MSGPKIDQVELERQRKAELERLRQEKLRKIREETERLNTEISKTKAQIDRIDKHLLPLVRNVENTDEMALTIPKLKELKASCKAQLTKALEINVPTEPDAILSCTYKLADITKSVVESYFNEAKPLEERISDYIEQLEIQNKVASMVKDFSTEKEEIKSIEDFDFVVTREIVKYSDTIEIPVKERATQILSEIEELINSESIQEPDMIRLYAVANKIYKTAFEINDSFEAVSIEYQVIKPIIVKNISIFDNVYQDYYAEYVVYLDLTNKNRIKPVSIMPKEKYSFSTIEELQEEVELLAQESKIVSENNYIREQIDHVMQNFGYNVSEEIVFDVNQTGNHYICENKSERSAIHVHISDKNQIMMEIVGVTENAFGSSNASVISGIVSSSELDERERSNLLFEQGGFCELHPKIIDELRKRDIVFNEKSRKPPDLKYSKKIIPVTIDNDTIITQSELINEHGTERRRAKGLKAKLREMKGD